MLSLGQEVKQHALVNLGLSDLAPVQQISASLIERSVQEGKESYAVLVQNLLGLPVEMVMNGHAV